MLAPRDRLLLREALRPPAGHRIDRAIATTYTLDLVALLLAPLSFSLFDAIADREKSLDSLALIRAVREHASRLSVFCQAEGIACPARYPLITQYLEGSVVPVAAPNPKGVFHVKLWVLRFVPEQSGPVHYRVLVPSRNLTFDRSWDSMLTLDGALTDRTRAYARNHPLADLVAALPKLAVAPPATRIVDDCNLVSEELRRVDFEVPDPFEQLAFYPLGIEPKSKNPFDERVDRLLVVSPFVSSSSIGKLAEGTHGSILVSRVEELARLRQQHLQPYQGGVYVLDEATTPDEDEDAVETSAVALPEAPPPNGLHAKIYVADAGRDAHVWTGSANATSAAFELNVELLVKLSGKKSKVGIEQVLNGAGNASLMSLLRAYTPADWESVEPEQPDPELDTAARSFATAAWHATVTRAADSPDEAYTITLAPEAIPNARGVRIHIWPITLAEGRAQAWLGEPLRFEHSSLEAITPFFAVRIAVGDGDEERTTTFVIRAELEGAPEHRPQRLLQNLLQDPERLMRFLELLLSTDPVHAVESEIAALEHEGSAQPGFGRGEPPLFEMLVRALARNPQQIEQVKSLVDELSGSSAEHPLLSEEFHRVWQPIWQAYKHQSGTP